MRFQDVVAANGKIANRFLLCSVTGRAARSFQVAGQLSSTVITTALHRVSEGPVIRPRPKKGAFARAA